MKPGIILLFIGATCIFSCKKDTAVAYKNEAVIAGINLTECPCVISCPCTCGGLLFHFTDSAYTENIALDNPAIFNITSGTKFPVRVKINWENTSRCSTSSIKITSYATY
jgi:hypothetical protein